jgi:oxygen-dependent protoporphyrinogen oxidase
MQRYVVVGGGISGLAAAWELSERVPGAQITVLESSERVGGKIRAGELAGLSVDVGAEAVLARRPEAIELIEQVGLGADLVHPAATTASVWSRGALHPMPQRTLMGVPAEPRLLAGLLDEDELCRAEHEELPGPTDEEDVAIGELVAARLGDAVVDRLVEPLLGGVYAGHARSISTAAALPALLEAHRCGEPLTEVVGRLMPASEPRSAPRLGPGSDPGVGPGAAPSPVFAGVRGGLHRLPDALTQALRARGVIVRTDTVVRRLARSRDPAQWELVTGPVPDPTTYLADRVVLALPPAPAARLLGTVAPQAAGRLAAVDTASTALVTLALPAEGLPGLPGSGLLVPPVEGRAIKAATFSAAKWDWVRELGMGRGAGGTDLVLLRASLGRHREESVLQRSDEELVALVLGDLAGALGAPLPAPVERDVQRWGGGLPQYAVGHRAAMAAVAEDVARLPGLELCGATYEGVGIPACIASGRGAATRLLGEPAPGAIGTGPGRTMEP